MNLRIILNAPWISAWTTCHLSATLSKCSFSILKVLPTLLPSRVVEVDEAFKKKSAIKLQVICDEDFNIRGISDGHSASVHDYKIFKKEFNRLKSKLDRSVLGDKAYIGLSSKGVLCPVKSNALNKENETDFNAQLSN